MIKGARLSCAIEQEWPEDYRFDVGAMTRKGGRSGTYRLLRNLGQNCDNCSTMRADGSRHELFINIVTQHRALLPGAEFP